LYPIFNKSINSTKALLESLRQIYTFLVVKYKRNFSLVAFVLLGIFYPIPSEAVKIATDSIPVSGVYNASFTFDLTTNAGPRTHVVPKYFYFTATDSQHMYTPGVPTAYLAWSENYLTNSWSAPLTRTLAIPTFDLHTQIQQTRTDTTMAVPQGNFFVARYQTPDFSTFELILDRYASSTSLLQTTNAATISLATGISPSTPFVMVQTKSLFYFFWIQSSQINTCTYDGSVVSAITPASVSELNTSRGLSGCTIASDGDEYVALIYAKSTSEFNLVTFKDGSYPTTSIQTINLGVSVDSGTKVAITQNPRTGRIILTWISGGIGYYRLYSFTPPATLSLIQGNTSFGTGFAPTFGVSNQSFSNFETVMTFSSFSNLSNYLLRSTPALHSTPPEYGSTVLFPFKEANRYYAGLVSFDYGKYSLFRRELAYPSEGWWDKNSKTLHLQGPPMPNTQVRIEFEFAEVASTTSLAYRVNSAGNRTPFHLQSGIIASSSSNLYTVKFDADMALVAADINSKIRMLDAANNPVILNHDSTALREISFRPATDLQFNAAYRITVASDVIDARGTQIWEAATLTFTTQPTSSSVLASEVKNIYAYRDIAKAQLIANGGEASRTATVYLRLDAVDPAFNTIDTATLSVLLNGSGVATTTLTQLTANSSYFDGQYTLNAPLTGTPTYSFRVPGSATSTSIVITYPTASPIFPAVNAENIEARPTIRIGVSESILPSTISDSTVRLLLAGVPVAANRTYNDGLKEITITPTSDLLSETTYTVSVSGLSDIYYNPQINALSYQFKIADIIPPEITTHNPSAGETGVTIDRHIFVNFTEPLLASSVNTSTVKLSRGGTAASYSVILSGSQIQIDPEDAPDGGLRPQTTYLLEIGNAVKDLAGNGLLNTPATFTLTFTTQPFHTPPTAISNITLYKDPLLIEGWGLYEKIPATATVYIKVIGSDGATQTRDLATATLNFSWGEPAKKILLTETASNSTGIYLGSFNFAAMPLYGFPAPLPPTTNGSMTFSVDLNPVEAATLTVAFPALVPADTTINTLNGSVVASAATNVRIDSPLILTFSEPLLNAGDGLSLSVASGASAIAGTRTLSADRRRITFQPASNFPIASKIAVTGNYTVDGLKSTLGNPLHRSFNFTFDTQAAQTQPSAVSQVILYPDASYSPANAYVTNQDFPRTGSVHIEVRGTDAASNTVDYTLVTISTGDSVSLTETGNNTGIYRGLYSYSGLNDGFVFSVTSQVDPAVFETLILSIPALSPQTPASGSTDVSVNTIIEVKASEALNASTVNSSNVKLFRAGLEVAGSVSYRVAEREIAFTPASLLATSSTYLYRISNVEDLAGNSLTAELAVSFTTQAETASPTPPVDLKLYADSAYTSELADLATVIPGAQIFARVTAIDTSPTTIDSAGVEQSSSLIPGTAITNLIETGFNTGIYQGAVDIFNHEVATITIRSLTDPTKFSRLKTLALPVINSIVPASGTAGVYLNQIFTINTSKDVNAATLNTSSIRLSDALGLAPYSITLPNPREIRISSELQASSPVVLRLSNEVKDIDGIAFADTTAHFTSLTPTFSQFRLYSDAGLTQLLNNNAEVEVGQLVYLRLDGNDQRLGVTDYATATLNSSLAPQNISLSESMPASFVGSAIMPDLPNETIEIVPENRTDLALNLRILPPFALASFSPASGAITVPADIWPTWNFTRPVRSSDITTANFSVKRVSDNSAVPGTLSVSPTGRQIRFQPAGLLPLLTLFEMAVTATVQDTSGNILGGSLATRFTTQPPPPPPSENIVLANYETIEYATKTQAVAFNDSLFLELVAKDTSFSTYETARVRIDSSDGSLDGLELTLVEISPPSGVYRLNYPINLQPGVTIRIQSQGDPDAVIEVITRTRTLLVSIEPASGSIGLFLDNPIRLNFTHSIDRNTVAAGIKLLASDARSIDLVFSYANSDRSVIITPDSSYASSTRHIFQIMTNLRDSNGLYLLPQTGWFTTRSEESATFDLLTGIAPRAGQSVGLFGEATPGRLVLVATTTNMLNTYPETRNIRLQSASGTFFASLSESAAGSFMGEYDLPAGISGDITATLLFAQQPALTFRMAELPQIVSIDPASGSSGVAELPEFAATFSRKLAFETTRDALRILTEQGNIITQVSGSETDRTGYSWRPLSPLPLQASSTFQFNGLTDYLGQPLGLYRHEFSTGGRQGINLFSDNSFVQLIATDQIEIPVVFIEVAASGTLNLSGQQFDLIARTGTRATETIRLKLEPFNPESGRFRCSLEFEPGKAVPQYPLALLPGEWLELTAPQLTSDRRILYYKHSGSAAPTNIYGIRLYAEKHFAQRVTDYIPNPTLYIEVEAEDRNWFTTDTTQVRVSSEADRTGFVLDLVENGTHSSLFRNFIRMTRNDSDPISRNLKTTPGMRIFIESVTDPAVRTSITYLPENGIRMMSVYPSPARGSDVNFRFYLNFPGNVALKIYDTAGDEVFSTDIRGQEGENVYQWRFPRKVANGTYFYTVRIDNESGFPGARQRVRGKFAILR
jgi:hypothetical protein